MTRVGKGEGEGSSSVAGAKKKPTTKEERRALQVERGGRGGRGWMTSERRACKMYSLTLSLSLFLFRRHRERLKLNV